MSKYFFVSDSVRYIRNKKGKYQLITGGYSFNVHTLQTRNDVIKTRWRCVKHKKGCLGVVHTINDVILKHICNHNHAPDFNR